MKTMVIKTNAEKFIKKIRIRVKNFKNDDLVKVKVLFGLILPKDVRCISTFIYFYVSQRVSVLVSVILFNRFRDMT